MKMNLLWITETLLKLTYPYGIIPLALFTYYLPWTSILWVILGVCGFAFGYKTWKYHVSKRDYWAKGEMGRTGDRMILAFLRLRQFCYFGATLIAVLLFLLAY